MANNFRRAWTGLGLMVLLAGCAPSRPPQPTATAVPPSPTATATALPSETPSPTDTATPVPTDTVTPVPTVGMLKATVTADLLKCHYGPGEFYLFLYGLRGGANIQLIGRADGSHWVWVSGRNDCWVNSSYLTIQGDWRALPVVYPGAATLPQSPYYPATAVTKVVRSETQVKVTWLEVPLRPGDEEDASMQHYIIEVWHCLSGQLVFDPLGTNDSSITFTDEPGCLEPSHGRIFVQEKHGFAGPAEIPWPPYDAAGTPTP